MLPRTPPISSSSKRSSSKHFIPTSLCCRDLDPPIRPILAPRTLSWHIFNAYNYSQRVQSGKKSWGRTSGALLRVLGRQIDDSITPIHGNAFGVRSREFGKVCLIDHQYSTSGVVGRRRVKLRQREVYPASTKVASKSYRDETTRL